MDINILIKEFIVEYGESGTKINVYFAPGRVNLIGEHTDYNGGFVFPCAISFGVYCLLRTNNRGQLRMKSLNMDYKADISVHSPMKPLAKEWANYPLGMLAQFIKKGMQPSGCDLLFYGNVPHGAGLSSSAAIEMATGCAINHTFGFGLDNIEIARMGQKAEHEFAGVNCGIMDQFASGLGKKGHALLLNCLTLDYELVPVGLQEAKIIIANTNSPHKLGSGQYNQRVAECKAAVEAIRPYKNISLLGELSWKDFVGLQDKIEDETLRKRARHVVGEVDRTLSAVEVLKSGDLVKFGRLMDLSHDSLRDDYEVTGIHLDTMVEEARKINGVLGSRMTGGGFGGSAVAIVKNHAVDTFVDEVGKNYQQRTGIKPAFYIAEAVDGAHFIGQW